jgi:hypothetical protein
LGLFCGFSGGSVKTKEIGLYGVTLQNFSYDLLNGRFL